MKNLHESLVSRARSIKVLLPFFLSPSSCLTFEHVYVLVRTYVSTYTTTTCSILFSLPLTAWIFFLESRHEIL